MSRELDASAAAHMEWLRNASDDEAASVVFGGGFPDDDDEPYSDPDQIDVFEQRMAYEDAQADRRREREAYEEDAA